MYYVHYIDDNYNDAVLTPTRDIDSHWVFKFVEIAKRFVVVHMIGIPRSVAINQSVYVPLNE